LNLPPSFVHITFTKDFGFQFLLIGSFFAEHGRYKSAHVVFECIDISDLNGNIDPTMLAMAFDIALRYV